MDRHCQPHAGHRVYDRFVSRQSAVLDIGLDLKLLLTTRHAQGVLLIEWGDYASGTTAKIETSRKFVPLNTKNSK